jgi:hypothetical protein
MYPPPLKVATTTTVLYGIAQSDSRWTLNVKRSLIWSMLTPHGAGVRASSAHDSK